MKAQVIHGYVDNWFLIIKATNKIMKNLSIHVTDRDVRILQFINEFGFCEIRHIEKEFNIKKRLSYTIIKRLIMANLVLHQRIYHQKHGIYFLTKQGAAYTPLIPLSSIPHNHYNHHLIVIDVYQKIKQLYPEMIWVTERYLIKEKFSKGWVKKGHIADGMLFLSDKKIAIEVELTLKTKARIETILKEYAKDLDITEIWYYCQPKTMNALQGFIEKMQFVKTIPIKDFLSG